MNYVRRAIAAATGARFALALLALSTFAGTICSAQEAQAQEAAPDVSNASLADLANIQVYSASKHLENASDAPSSVTVVTADQIQKYGFRTLADILQSVRDFYITYDRDYSFVGVRGFGRLEYPHSLAGGWSPYQRQCCRTGDDRLGVSG
jgi:outer membrane receptor for ferrienterochelin and colicin